MSKYEKLIDKMKTKPNAIRPEEIEYVLNHNDYFMVRQRGSHMIYRNDLSKQMIIIPRRNPLKACYVEEVLLKVGETCESK